MHLLKIADPAGSSEADCSVRLRASYDAQLEEALTRYSSADLIEVRNIVSL